MHAKIFKTIRRMNLNEANQNKLKYCSTIQLTFQNYRGNQVMSHCACVTLIKYYIHKDGTQNIQSLAFSRINSDILATQQ